MVTFNIHHGTQRKRPSGLSVSISGDQELKKPVEGVASRGNYFRPTSPKKLLIMAHPKTGKGVQYDADKVGNIAITIPTHLGAMRGLGYPIYTGSNPSVVTWEDLLFARFDLADDPYDRLILEAISARSSG